MADKDEFISLTWPCACEHLPPSGVSRAQTQTCDSCHPTASLWKKDREGKNNKITMAHIK